MKNPLDLQSKKNNFKINKFLRLIFTKNTMFFKEKYYELAKLQGGCAKAAIVIYK